MVTSTTQSQSLFQRKPLESLTNLFAWIKFADEMTQSVHVNVGVVNGSHEPIKVAAEVTTHVLQHEERFLRVPSVCRLPACQHKTRA